MGDCVPQGYRGLGLHLSQYMTVVEEFARLDAAVSLSLLARNSRCVGHIMRYGSEAQQQVWLLRLTSGKHTGAWAPTDRDSRGLSCSRHRKIRGKVRKSASSPPNRGRKKVEYLKMIPQSAEEMVLRLYKGLTMSL